MVIAVGLQTCDRPAYTERTLATFSAMHPDARDRFLLLHADDASTDGRNVDLAAAHGFDTVARHTRRRGIRATRVALIAAAAARGAAWFLLLENDWEWIRPFPWILFDHLVTTRPDVYTLRLYGVYKERGNRRPCSVRNHGQPPKPPLPWWKLPGSPEPVEIARMHWGAPPAVTRLHELQQIHAWTAGRPELSDRPEMIASGRIDAYAARVVDNCVFHIGEQRTAPAAGSAARARALASRQAIVIQRPAARSQRIVRPSVARPAVERPPVARYTPEWQATRRWTIPGAVRCFERALDLLDPTPRSVLDVGCGEGAIVARAARAGLDAVGVDLSAPPGTDPVRFADLRAPLALGRTFDCVLCWEVAEHLPAAAADTLCDSLVAHLAPGGVLLFTAAQPGQRGKGHLNEQPLEYWRARLAARGLAIDPDLSRRLSVAWATAAPSQPWYGRNIVAAVAPGVRAGVAVARVAITIRTADRSPNPNYVGGTVKRLLAQGIDPALVHVNATHPNVAWLERQLNGAPVTMHVPTRPLSPNENGLAQIRNLDPNAWDLVLLLEDDLEFCARFLPSVRRWFRHHSRPNRYLYRLFGFRVHPPKASVRAYDNTLDRYMAGSQAVVLRMADARAFLAWADANLETWGHFRGNARISFDKLLASWSKAVHPGVPAVMSHPFFVRHIGDVSSIHPRAIRNDRYFPGASWSYAEASC